MRREEDVVFIEKESRNFIFFISTGTHNDYWFFVLLTIYYVNSKGKTLCYVLSINNLRY